MSCVHLRPFYSVVHFGIFRNIFSGSCVIARFRICCVEPWVSAATSYWSLTGCYAVLILCYGLRFSMICRFCGEVRFDLRLW
jgi:hypothetical protein